MMKIVIAGGGVAAFEAALAARKNCSDCEIEIHSAESVPPYRRPALPGLICADEADFAKMFIRKEDFYRENDLKLVLNSRLTGMDTVAGKALFNGTAWVVYDKLILATGGKSFVPPVPGAEGKNVLTLRNLTDLQILRQKIAAGLSEIIVVGGGILGLEIVDSLLKCHCKVTLLERSDRLLSRDVSPENSRLMQQSLAGLAGLTLICNAQTGAVTPEGVLLETGEQIPGQLVLFSTGSRPELSGISPEIAVDKGIIVDKYMQTNIPGVFSCGDNTQFDGKVCGLYSTSRAMAAVAGANASGTLTEYIPKVNTIMLNTLGFKMSSDGKVTVTK